MNHPRVLIVEDDPSWIAALNDFLRLSDDHLASSVKCPYPFDKSDLYERIVKSLDDYFRRCILSILGRSRIAKSLKPIQDAQRESARAGFNRQLKRSNIIKALHKPLQVIPQSIHPIDAAA